MSGPRPGAAGAGGWTPPRCTAYPEARREDYVEDLFGNRVADPYRWLEDSSFPETVGWQNTQEGLYSAFRAAHPEREGVLTYLEELTAVPVVSAPAWRGDRYFMQRRDPGQEHAVVYVVDSTGAQRPVIDPVRIDPTGRTTLDVWQPSRSGRLVAYQLSADGTEESVLRVLDVDTGEVVDGPLDRVRHASVAWLPGDDAFYYVRRLPPEDVDAEESQYHRRVWLHRVGTDATADVQIFGDSVDQTRYYGVSVSHDGRWLLVTTMSGATRLSGAWIADLNASPLESPVFRPVQKESAESSVVFIGPDGLGYAATNRGAPRGRLCVFDPATEDADDWRTLIEERPDAVLRTVSFLAGDRLDRPLLLVNWSRRARSLVTIHDVTTGLQLGQLPLPGLGTVGALGVRPEGGHEAWFTYSDWIAPPRVYHYDASAGNVTGWSTTDDIAVPAARALEVTYTSRDGTPVRMVLTAPAGVDPAAGDAPRPVLMRGYGGFGVSSSAQYSPQALAWVRAGGVYVDTQLRGGGEEGEQWHHAGMRERKQNVFDDFHAAAQWLIATGWTTPEQLAIIGASNGGLLVGAAITQRPDLYGCAVSTAPLLDMVRYERFGLGRSWRGEYGSASVAEELAWLLSYSPYHHVRAGTRYPAVLLVTFDNDTRVDPLHARKMCAALQHATAGPAPILLRREDLGHGARAMSSSLALLADQLVFAATHTGLDLARR